MLFRSGVLQDESKKANVGGPLTTEMRTLGLEKLWLKQREQKWGSWSFLGGIDEVYIFSRALNAGEIQRLMSR